MAAVDELVRIRLGEKWPVYGKVNAGTATFTVSSGSVTITDMSGGTVVATAAVTGYDAGALAAPRVWYTVDTSSGAMGTVGWYTAAFKISGSGSDNIARFEYPEVRIVVEGVPA